MNRIDSIVNLINDKNATVIDIGCDHALLSIKLLKNKHCNFVYNVDINKKPLLNGIRNIKKNNLSKQTKNIQNDGLKNWKYQKKIDFVTISGVGAKTIIKILSNIPKDMEIKNFILVSNTNPFELRKFLKKFYFHYEEIIKENKRFYWLMHVNKIKSKYIANSRESMFLGPYNIHNPTKKFIELLKEHKEFIEMNKLSIYNKFKLEKKIINDYFKKNISIVN